MNIGKMNRLERELKLLIQVHTPKEPHKAILMFAPILFSKHDDPNEFEYVPFLTPMQLPEGINHLGDFLRYAQLASTRVNVTVRQMPFTKDYLEVMTSDEQTEWKLYGIDTMDKADKSEWSGNDE